LDNALNANLATSIRLAQAAVPQMRGEIERNLDASVR